jgi:hypothetical protein
MTEIYNYITYDSIEQIDDYNSDTINIYNFNNVYFRAHISKYLGFCTPLGIYNNKIISITNKQFSFFVQKNGFFLGHEYANELQNTYNCINTFDTSIICVEEEVFQFIDYEATNGTGHTYDLLFYLLYHYKLNNLKSKLIVLESSNKYYNNLLKLINNNYNVEYFYIKPQQTYLFKHFKCIRTYQNILFNEVKHFINESLIQPIIEKYDK